jgi:hypothetical protein
LSNITLPNLSRRVAVLLAVALSVAGLQLGALTPAHAASTPLCFNNGIDPNVYYKITNAVTGKALDVSRKSTTAGAPVIGYAYNGGTNQQWRVICSTTGTTFRVIAKHSGQVLEVVGASTAEGAKTEQYPYSSATHQQWTFSDPSNSGTGFLNYQLVNLNSGKALDMAADNVTVLQSTPSGSVRQQWTFEKVATL